MRYKLVTSTLLAFLICSGKEEIRYCFWHTQNTFYQKSHDVLRMIIGLLIFTCGRLIWISMVLLSRW